MEYIPLGFDIDLGKFFTRILTPSERQINALERLVPVATSAFTQVSQVQLMNDLARQQGSYSSYGGSAGSAGSARASVEVPIPNMSGEDILILGLGAAAILMGILAITKKP